MSDIDISREACDTAANVVWSEPLSVADARGIEHLILALRTALDAAEADKQRAVMREQRLARRIHMQRAQLRWLNAWMAGDLQITRMHMLRKTLMNKRVPTPFGPDPSALRAAWDVVLRRVYGASAIRTKGGEP